MCSEAGNFAAGCKRSGDWRLEIAGGACSLNEVGELCVCAPPWKTNGILEGVS